MKYLINETLCEKVELEGFDYYVNDSKITNYCYILSQNSIYPLWVDGTTVFPEMLDLPQWKKIIATNDRYLDLPQVVNEAKETYQYAKEDMVEFGEWIEEVIENMFKHEECYNKGVASMTLKNINKLFDIWNEQRIIKLNVK